jgi:hypothetical protein
MLSLMTASHARQRDRGVVDDAHQHQRVARARDRLAGVRRERRQARSDLRVLEARGVGEVLLELLMDLERRTALEEASAQLAGGQPLSLARLLRSSARCDLAGALGPLGLRHA